VCMLLHVLMELIEGYFNITYYDIPDCRNIPVVLLFSLKGFTGAFAITQMIFQANPVLSVSYFFFSKVIITGAQRIKTFYKVQQSIHSFKSSERAIILTAIFDKPAGWKNPWKSFIFNTYPWIGFIILKHHVKPWLVLLYQIVLQ